MFQITEDIILPEVVANKVRADDSGAVITFVGTVRNFSEGKRVLYLEYEAYKEMAEKKLRQIADEIDARWGLKNVAICHRVGRLEVGEIAVAIAVSAPHRIEAFDACCYAVDRLKQIVPIWKKEVWQDGEGWVGHVG